MLVYFGWAHFYVSLAILAIVLIFLRQQNKGLSFLLCFAIFWVYLMGVVSVVVFPIHIPEGHPEFARNLQINLVPFDLGGCYYLRICLRNVYANILLTIPFGFGVSFVSNIKPGKIPWLAVTVGLVFELTQLIIALIVRSAFRVVDINDVIFNAVGVLLGYGLFRVFGVLYATLIEKLELQPRHIFAYIHDIVRQQN